MMPQMNQQQQPQQAQPGQPQQGGSPVEAIDQMLGMMTDALSKDPAAEMLANRMAKLREEYRSIVTQAAKMAEGGGGAGQRQGAPTIPRSNPVMDRSQGMPASPAGAY